MASEINPAHAVKCAAVKGGQPLTGCCPLTLDTPAYSLFEQIDFFQVQDLEVVKYQRAVPIIRPFKKEDRSENENDLFGWGL